MFLKGLILGFSIAAPVGPIGLLCIQRTLSRGRLHGFVSGLGAATADACYGLVAGCGLSALTNWLLGLQFWLQLAGGLFLLWLGSRTLLVKPPDGSPATSVDRAGLAGAFVSILLLTLANPVTILSFFALFAGLGLQPEKGQTAAMALVAGVFFGSAAWWLALSFFAGLLRRRLRDGRLRVLNMVAGLSILALAAWSLRPVITTLLF